MFFDEPRILMGLSKNSTRVIRVSAAEEETRFRALAKLDEKDMSVVQIEKVSV